jgi:hypothetical protein
MSPKRFLSGISNVDGSKPLANFPYLDPTKYSVYMEDFFAPGPGAAVGSSATATYAGILYSSPGASTISFVTDADANGALSMVTTAADNIVMYAYSVANGMRMRSGKKFFMRTRFEPTVAGTIGQEEIFIGLADQVSIAASATAFMTANGIALATDDAIGFVSYDGSAEVSVVVSENDVRDHVPVGTAMVSATWMDLAIYFDGTDIYYYVNDVAAGAFTPTAIPVSPVGPMFWFKNGEGQIKTLLVDYLFVACER